MSKAGFDDTASRLAIARLVKLKYASFSWERDPDNDPYVVYGITQEGEDWLIENQELLVLTTSKSKPEVVYADEGITDEDIPF